MGIGTGTGTGAGIGIGTGTGAVPVIGNGSYTKPTHAATASIKGGAASSVKAASMTPSVAPVSGAASERLVVGGGFAAALCVVAIIMDI